MLVGDTFSVMNLRLLPSIAAATLALSTITACGGGEGGSSAAPTSSPAKQGDGGATTETRGAVPAVDLGALGGRLKGWEGCSDEPEVDMAGYPVLVCIFPDEYAVPGQDGNAVRLMAFTEWDQADTYVAEYGDPEVTVVEGGYIVDGPHAKAVNAAVSLLKK